MDVKLYRPREGRKEFTGALEGYQDGDVTVNVAGESVTFAKKEVALVRLHVKF